LPSSTNESRSAESENAALIAAARAGSNSKLGELLERMRRYLLLAANQSLNAALRPKQAASDLVQETFLEARRNFAQFRGENRVELLGWLCKILENKSRDVSRRYRLSEMRNVSREESIDDLWKGRVGALVDPGPSPSALVAAQEEAKRLEAAMRRLSDEDQEVLRLRSLERLTFSEVGRRTGRTTDAARKQWTRAVARLERELTQDDESG
jgi:RNA polymerase sigma-70 factor (ECF subfamily)